jgi:signal transduction histidine kinase
MGKPSTVMKFLFKRKDGGLRWVETDARLIRKHRVPIGLQGIMKDITELEKSEKSLKEAIRETEALNEKLRVVTELTRHDIRNRLQVARNNFFLAKQELSDNPETSKLIQSLESTCGEVERILDFARDYEMLGIEELAHIDTKRAIDAAVSLFSDLHGVKVLNECHGLTVLSDSLIQQLFYNLIDNSLKYGEKVTQIRMFCEETSEQAMKLVYEDDGIGISKGEKERIFQKGYGKGTGYGLWLVREICKVYGWTIRETGKHGKGARFTMTIPRLSQDGRENYCIRKLTESA